MRAEILNESGMHKVLPVALTEYCITQAEGFNARSFPEIVSRLAGHAQAGLYLRYIVALFGNGVDEKNVPRLRLSSRRGLLAPPARHHPALLPGRRAPQR